MTLQPLNVQNRFFIQSDKRIKLLRGVNLSGSTKQPFQPLLPSHEPNQFYSIDCSFVGRPFPLTEAHVHFKRLKNWGCTFLRLNTTWEAIEHQGPGIYDYEYINYLIQLLKKAREFGFQCFIDPHQDVWSRFSGGSGAPFWTFEKVGLVPQNFMKCQAAIVQSQYENPSMFPKMIWPTNYWKLGCATMFTLFFGGKMFAPSLLIDGKSAQEYLQEHFMNAICEVAKRVVQEGLTDVVVGYDTLNEPGHGWIGLEDIRVLAVEQSLRKGYTPTPLQAMLMGQGISQEIEYWDMTSVGPQKMGERVWDPQGTRVWVKECIWAQHKVYDPVTLECLRPNYFSIDPQTGKEIDFLVDFWKPFVNKFSKKLRNIHKDCIMFIEPPVNAIPPVWEKDDVQGPICFAPHWYDGLTLINKHWNSWYNIDYIGFLRGKYASIAFAVKIGETAIKNCFQSQLRMIREEGEQYVGAYPTLFGEIGIPFDMDGKHAYKTGDYSAQLGAMDANMTALERDLLSFTLWNYCSDNDHVWGDQWNGEDLSLWSKSDIHGQSMTTIPHSTEYDPKESERIELDRGGRALLAFVRPYALLTPGTLKSQSFDMKQTVFTMQFQHELNEKGWPLDADASPIVEIFVPNLHYADGVDVYVSCGTFEWSKPDQKLLWRCGCKDINTPTEQTFSQQSNRSSSQLKRVGSEFVVHKLVLRKKQIMYSTPIEEEGEVEKDGICPQCSIM